MRRRAFPGNSKDMIESLDRVLEERSRPDTTTTETTVLEYRVDIITPMFGGGVKAGEVDMDMPVRAKAIRGQLRYWWRLLAANDMLFADASGKRISYSGAELFAREIARWGGIASHAPKASRMHVAVDRFSGFSKPVPYEIQTKTNKGMRLRPDRQFAPAAYALFPAQHGEEDHSPPKNLLPVKQGSEPSFRLRITVRGTDHQKLAKQVAQCVRYWATFGGLGARARRGIGAIRVVVGDNTSSLQTLGLPTLPESGGIKISGPTPVGPLQVVLRGPFDSAMIALADGLAKLKDFRQTPGIARRGTSRSPGTSYWPEPDALRRLSGDWETRHAPTHAAGNIFPRASMGMPIGTRFHRDHKDDPPKSEILPERAGSKRMASPVIIKPVALSGGKFAAMAALLPGARAVLIHKVTLNHKWKSTAPISASTNSFEIWPSSAPLISAAKAAIEPMSKLAADNPLDAFLEFFAQK